MKAKQIGFGVLVMLFIVSALFLFSCGKKEIKSEGIVSQPPAPVGEETEKAKKQVQLKEQEPSASGIERKDLKRRRSPTVEGSGRESPL